MFTGNLNTLVHDLVIVIAYMGVLFSGYAGMTVWARKGGRPGGGFFIGGLLGALGVFILVLANPRQTEIESAARSRGLVPCSHCAELIRHQARVCRHCQRDIAAAEQSSGSDHCAATSPGALLQEASHG